MTTEQARAIDVRVASLSAAIVRLGYQGSTLDLDALLRESLTSPSAPEQARAIAERLIPYFRSAVSGAITACALAEFGHNEHDWDVNGRPIADRHAHDAAAAILAHLPDALDVARSSRPRPPHRSQSYERSRMPRL